MVAHELLTGARLFGGTQSFETLRRMHEADVAPPSHVNPSLPAEIDALVMRALARDPVDRTPTADALWRELYTCMQELGLDASPDGIANYLDGLMDQRAELAEGVLEGLGDEWLPTTDVDSYPPV